MSKPSTPTHENIEDPDSKIRVKFWSKKPLFGRRQWYWRARHLNGHIMCWSGEGYNNLDDCEQGFRICARLLRYAPVTIERPIPKS